MLRNKGWKDLGKAKNTGRNKQEINSLSLLSHLTIFVFVREMLERNRRFLFMFISKFLLVVFVFWWKK
jgi:hypothetical protein